MKFTNSPIPGTYAEVPQTNPLRWANLYKEGTDETGDLFSYQSKVWKCKDFLNEFVSLYHGHSCVIYGFDASTMKTNEEGIYVHLTNLLNVASFIENIKSINSWAEEQGFPAVELTPVDGTSVIALLPRKYFDCTYSISFLSYWIRVANVTMTIDDWEKHPTKPVDNPFGEYFDKAIEQGFKPPIDGYWFYLMKDHTNLEEPKSIKAIHDNGVHSWFNCLTLDEVI
jgi:hypothetical protein